MEFYKAESAQKDYHINCPQEWVGFHPYLSFLLPLGTVRRLERVGVPVLGFEAEM